MKTIITLIYKTIFFLITFTYKIIFYILKYTFKTLFFMLNLIFILPFSWVFQRDSRCHWSKASRFNTKIKYHSEKFDKFVWDQEVFNIAWENIPKTIISPIKNTTKMTYTIWKSLNTDYLKIIK